MPVYEYECTKCGHHTEVFQKISDAPLETCSLCNGKIKKLISQSTFHLKGTGWYVTDYASRNRTSEAKKDKAPTATKETEATPTKAKESSVTKTATESSGTVTKKTAD